MSIVLSRNTIENFNKVERVSAAEFKELTEVWEASFRVRHHFLKVDILFYKILFDQYLQVVDFISIVVLK